jgi:hypothetical protein
MARPPGIPDSPYDVKPNDAAAAAAWYEAALIAGVLEPEDGLTLLHMQDDRNGRELLKLMAEIEERTGIKPPRRR